MFEPKGYRVVVKPDPLEEKVGSIILAHENKSASKHRIQTGTVLRMGPLVWSQYDGPNWAKEGDKVLFIAHGGIIFKEEDEEIRILNDEDIIGVIT